MTQNEVIRLVFSIALAAVGALMVFLSGPSELGALASHVGFAFIVAGVLSTFHEAVLSRFEHSDFASHVADRVHEKLKASPPTASGIRLVSPQRQGYRGYYTWVIGSGPGDYFFAGRSVLHRIDADIRRRTAECAEKVILRRLLDGSSISILLLDPRSDLIPRVAREEKQTEVKLLTDLAHSIGVCIRLARLLQDVPLPPSASLQICVFDRLPLFAFHRADDLLTVGFYFASSLGYKSAAYEVLDQATEAFFTDHFRTILVQSEHNYVVRVSTHANNRPEINEALIESMVASIQKTVGVPVTQAALNAGAIASET